MRIPGTFVVASLLLVACDLKRPQPEPVDLVSVADAPKHYEDQRLRFRGTARADLHGREDWVPPAVGRSPSGSPAPRTMVVVPVVPEGWTTADPVPLWISAPDTRPDDVEPWLARVSEVSASKVVGRVVDHAKRPEAGGLGRKESGWQRAIAAAEAQHGIHSDPHAPIVHWPETK